MLRPQFPDIPPPQALGTTPNHSDLELICEPDLAFGLFPEEAGWRRTRINGQSYF